MTSPNLTDNQSPTQTHVEGDFCRVKVNVAFIKHLRNAHHGLYSCLRFNNLFISTLTKMPLGLSLTACANEAGVIDYLTKPFDSDDLRAKLDKFVAV